jgi:hypothetical protein
VLSFEDAMRLSLLLLAMTLTACPGPAPQGQEVVLLPYPDDGGVVWDGWAGAFVRDYCVECHQPSAPCGGSGCHAAGDPLLFDFHDESAVIERSSTIRCGIAVAQDPSWGCGGIPPKTFPIVGDGNPLPTDEQRGIVVGWIDSGCP